MEVGMKIKIILVMAAVFLLSACTESKSSQCDKVLNSQIELLQMKMKSANNPKLKSLMKMLIANSIKHKGNWKTLCMKRPAGKVQQMLNNQKTRLLRQKMKH